MKSGETTNTGNQRKALKDSTLIESSFTDETLQQEVSDKTTTGTKITVSKQTFSSQTASLFLNWTLFFFKFTASKTFSVAWLTAQFSLLFGFLMCSDLLLLCRDWNVPLNSQSGRLCKCSKENDSYRRVWTWHSRGAFQPFKIDLNADLNVVFNCVTKITCLTAENVLSEERSSLTDDTEG